jgi:hypothetical protein
VATKEEKEYKAAQRQAAQQSLASERARAGSTAKGTLVAPRMRAAGDMSRYQIGAFADDPAAAAKAKEAAAKKAAGTAKAATATTVKKVYTPPKPPAPAKPKAKPAVRQPAPVAKTSSRVPTKVGTHSLSEVRRYVTSKGTIGTTVVRTGTGSKKRSGGPAGKKLATPKPKLTAQQRARKYG